VEQDEKEMIQTKEILNDFLGEILDGDQFNNELIESLDNNLFIINNLAEKAIRLYTRVDPKLVYFALNSLCAKGYETRFPILFPLANLISLGLTNYYDVSGSLNISNN